MTPIEQLAKEFSKGNPAIEAAFLAGMKQGQRFGIEFVIGYIECEIAEHGHEMWEYGTYMTGLEEIRDYLKGIL